MKVASDDKDDEFDARNDLIDAAGLDDIDDIYYDHDDELGVRKFHGHAAGLDDVDDCDDEESDGMGFHSVSKNYERVHDNGCYAGKYRAEAHSV